MNWSRKHLNKIRRFYDEWARENGIENDTVVVSVSRSKYKDFYFQRDFIDGRFHNYRCSYVIGGNHYD